MFAGRNDRGKKDWERIRAGVSAVAGRRVTAGDDRKGLAMDEESDVLD